MILLNNSIGTNRENTNESKTRDEGSKICFINQHIIKSNINAYTSLTKTVANPNTVVIESDSDDD